MGVPLYNLMLKKLKEKCELLHCDETTMQCNKEPGKKASSNSYMWVLVSGESEKSKGVIFSYSKNRSGETAQKLLKDFRGILVTVSAPILKKFYEWVSLTNQKYITNKKLKEALTYAENQNTTICST